MRTPWSQLMADPVYRSCTRKKKYSTLAHAEEVARADERNTRRLTKKRIVLSAYQCRHCGCWHLTSRRR